MIDTQHTKGFIGIVCNLRESKTYQTLSSIYHFFSLKKPLKRLNSS